MEKNDIGHHFPSMYCWTNALTATLNASVITQIKVVYHIGECIFLALEKGLSGHFRTLSKQLGVGRKF